MTANQVHAALQNEAVYTSSRKMWQDRYSATSGEENTVNAVLDMRLCLKAHGFNSTTNHAIHMLNHAA